MLLRLARRVVLPLLLIASGALLWRLGAARVDLVLATTGTWVAVLVVLVLLERAMPYERAWHVPDGQLPHDFGHAFLGSAVGSRLGGLGVELAVAALLAAGAPTRVWPAAWPFLVQILLAYVAIDGLRYAQHRAQHRFSWLWSTHVLHHDPRRLIAVKAGRSHILDRAMQALCAFPVVLAGAPADVLFLCIGLNSVVGLIGHANIDVRAGWLGLIVVGPEQHRVHHGLARAQHGANFGASLMIWDRLFGTAVDTEVREVGVPDATPSRFVAQLAAPFQ